MSDRYGTWASEKAMGRHNHLLSELCTKRCPVFVSTELESSFEMWCDGYGCIPADFMFVGISAGRLGALLSKVPFTKDASGRLLQRCLGELGFSHSDEFSLKPDLQNCYITNLVKGRCLTPEGMNRLPSLQEIQFWEPTFLNEVELVQPKVILCLSNIVFQTVVLRYPGIARRLKHPRWYQAHGALSNKEAFREMVRDYSQEVHP